MKINKIYSTLIIAGVISASSIVSASEPVATVNGTPISQRSVDSFIQHRRMQPDANTRKMVLEELIKIELLAQDAEKLKLQESEEVKETIEALTKQVMAQARLRNYAESANISDEQIQKAYAEKYQADGASEFNARHILLKTEDDAKAVIKELEGGADFAKLANEKSTGPSGPSGGDLGWFEPAQMVKPFADAVKAMEKGTFSKAPVETKFGWHVIKLEDTRSAEPPALESVRAEIEQSIRTNAIDNLISTLRESAKIEVK